jgi:hypothetical protein
MQEDATEGAVKGISEATRLASIFLFPNNVFLPGFDHIRFTETNPGTVVGRKIMYDFVCAGENLSANLADVFFYGKDRSSRYMNYLAVFFS